MNPVKVNLLVLRSPDMDRAVNFYQELGLEFTKHSHGKGPEHYASEVDGFVFEIYPHSPSQLPTTSTRIGFRVNLVEEVLLRLLSLGAEVVSNATNSPWGTRAVVKDLDGHLVELIEPIASEKGL